MKRKLLAVLALGVVTSLGASVAMAQKSNNFTLPNAVWMQAPDGKWKLMPLDDSSSSWTHEYGRGFGGKVENSVLPIWLDFGNQAVSGTSVVGTLNKLPADTGIQAHGFIPQTDVPDVVAYAVNADADFSMRKVGDGVSEVTLRMQARGNAK